MPTIDNLDIEISASAKSADTALTNLVNKLGILSKQLGNIDTKGLPKFASGLKIFSEAMQGLSNIDVPDYKRIADGIKKIEKIDGKKISEISSNLQPLASGLKILNNANFDNKNLQSFINSITRLAKTNINNLNFSTIGKSIEGLAKNFAKLPRIQQSTLSLTTALARLAKSATGIPIVTSSLNPLQRELNTFFKTMSKVPIISEYTVSFSQAIASLANAGAKTGVTAANLKYLATELKNFMVILSKSPNVSQNIIDMTNALAALARTGSTGGRAANSLGTNLLSYNKVSKRSIKGTKGLASALGKMYATYWLVFRAAGKLKEAIDISSDLTEVQNVVDVTFGKYSNLVEEMSKNSITDFGMSELTVKQVASRFQAMGSAIGISQQQVAKSSEFLAQKGVSAYGELGDSMANMSINLTKLAADMASFYNVEQSAVAEDLASVFTGETRPLRTYGLDLTQATLSEWAMKQGLDANIQSMSQAEKTMLRYQYVLANTTAAQGDFVRTADKLCVA